MENLEYFLRPTQHELFNLIFKRYSGKAIAKECSYILVKGEAPIMLLAHLDTVHEKPVQQICKSEDGNIIMSPQGVGGDDRCGVYAIVKAYEQSKVKPWLLFTCDEEVGGIGASAFVDRYYKGELPKDLLDLKFLIEIDRKGKKDAVYYGCRNTEFEDYITSKGFVTDHGSFSDISTIAPALEVAAVNLSSGYYNAHTKHEYINCKQLENVISKVIEIVAEAAKPETPQYEYIDDKWDYTDGWSDTDTFADMYDYLSDIYTDQQLDEFCELYGDGIISQLYNAKLGSSWYKHSIY